MTSASSSCGRKTLRKASRPKSPWRRASAAKRRNVNRNKRNASRKRSRTRARKTSRSLAGGLARRGPHPGEDLLHALDRQPDHVGQAPLDQPHVRVVLLLDGVRPGAALPGARGEIRAQLLLTQAPKKDPALLLERDLQIIGPSPQDDAGPQLVLAAAQRGEDAAGVGFVGRLADDLAVEPADRIGRQDEAGRD